MGIWSQSIQKNVAKANQYMIIYTEIHAKKENLVTYNKQ